MMTSMVKLADVQKEIQELRKEVAHIKSILGENELSEQAKKALDKARKTPRSQNTLIYDFRSQACP
jgi:hypothetical protein